MLKQRSQGQVREREKLELRHSLPQTRKFHSDFASVVCPQRRHFSQEGSLATHFPPINFLPTSSEDLMSNRTCDTTVISPVLIVSHDSVLNLGHMFEDILNFWTALELAEVDSRSVTLVNIDGLRPGNILKGQGHHILDSLFIDSLGPFRSIYDVMFGRVISAADAWGAKILQNQTIAGQRVCFTGQVLLYPMPLKAYLWDKFEVDDPCSLTLQPSYIYRKFVSEYHSKWRRFGDLERIRASLSLANHSRIAYYPPATVTTATRRILLITRKHVTSARTVEISARAFANPREVIDDIREHLVDKSNGDGAFELLVADFSDLSFPEQVALAHSVDILVGFHGAGINHLFHMDYRRAG